MGFPYMEDPQASIGWKKNMEHPKITWINGVPPFQETSTSIQETSTSIIYIYNIIICIVI